MKRGFGTRDTGVEPIAFLQFPQFGGWDLRLFVVEERGGSFVQVFGGEEVLVAELDELVIGHVGLVLLLGVIGRVAAVSEYAHLHVKNGH